MIAPRYKPLVDHNGTEAPREPIAPRFSALARASAIVGSLAVLLSCCGGGLGGPIAVLLGLIALDRIKASGGMLRGRATAIAGICLGGTGMLATLATQWTLASFQSSMRDQLDVGVRSTFAAVDDAGGSAALDHWAAPAGSVIRGSDLRAFAIDARERFGTFESYSVTSEVPAPSLTGVHRITLAVNFEFSNGSMPGVIGTRVTTSTRSWKPTMLLESLEITDHGRGGLAVGGRAGGREAQTETEGRAEDGASGASGQPSGQSGEQPSEQPSDGDPANAANGDEGT